MAAAAAQGVIDLLYLEPEPTDYHPGHVRLFAERAARDPRVRSLHYVLAPGYAADRTGILEMIQAAPNQSFEFCSDELVRLVAPDSGLAPRELGAVRLAEARRILAERPGATVFNSPFDDVLTAAALDRKPIPGKLTGVVMFCTPAVTARSLLTRLKFLARYALARRKEIPLVFTFDQTFLDRAPRAITGNWRFTPDPLPLTAAQFDRLMHAPAPAPKDRVEFLLFGGIGPHKGVFEILDALRALTPSAQARTRVRFLGKFVEGGPVMRQKFVDAIDAARAATQVEIAFEEVFASEDDLIDAMSACDVMLATRRHHQGVSNNLIWAAAAGRPVISQQTGWMGQIVEREKLGITCEPLDPVAVAAAMTLLLDPARRASFDVTGPRTFATSYTADGYYEAIVAGLSGVGRPTAEALRKVA
jgi:glycosyltransferase involved in cell wall biosynthesis